MFGNKTARDQQRVVDQIAGKLRDKERCENDQDRAQGRLKQNPSDTGAARDLQRATQDMERIERDISNLKNQF